MCTEGTCISEYEHNVSLNDGPIQIRYESHLSVKEVEDWKVANFNRLFASLNVDSGVRINNLAKKIKSDSENDYIQLLSVLGNDYQLNWLYTNKFPYI